MFDDICMVCGKFLDSGLVYCSDLCQSADRSPSLSSTTASSAFTSPYISAAALAPLADVPPLVLTKRMSLGASSSSASSDVNSVFEYDDDNDDDEDQKPDHAFHLPPLDTPDPDTINVPSRSFAFARRPSHADNRTLIPVLPPHKASSHSLSHRPSRSHDLRASTPTPTPPQDTPKSKHSRASLPAYFSHLQLSSHRDRGSPSPSRPLADSPPKEKKQGTREQMLYDAARSLSGRIGADNRSASTSRGRVALPVPGSHDGERSRVMMRDDGETRGRSRVVTPRVKLLQS